jgi:hypothetical protein
MGGSGRICGLHTKTRPRLFFLLLARGASGGKNKGSIANTRGVREGDMADKPNGASITKKEAVQQALAELGKAAKSADLQKYAKEKFGLDISSNLVKEYKGDLLKGKTAAKQQAAAKLTSKESTVTKKPTAKKPATAKPPAAKPPGQVGSAVSGIPLQDILTIKELVGRLGAKPVHVLIDAFAK